MQSLWARGPQHCPSFTEFNENIPQRQYLLLVERLWQINGGFLDMQYTVFGYVVEGLDIIDSIAAVPTDRRRGDRPMEDVVMSMKRLN